MTNESPGQAAAFRTYYVSISLTEPVLDPPVAVLPAGTPAQMTSAITRYLNRYLAPGTFVVVLEADEDGQLIGVGTVYNVEEPARQIGEISMEIR